MDTASEENLFVNNDRQVIAWQDRSISHDALFLIWAMTPFFLYEPCSCEYTSAKLFSVAIINALKVQIVNKKYRIALYLNLVAEALICDLRRRDSKQALALV